MSTTRPLGMTVVGSWNDVDLVRATPEGVLENIGSTPVIMMWRSEDTDPMNPLMPRMRPSIDKVRGVGGWTKHPSAAAYLSTPKNFVYLPSNVDMTFVEAMQRQGRLHQFRRVESLDGLMSDLTLLGDPRVYINDDFGTRFDRWAVNDGKVYRHVSRKTAIAELVPNDFRPEETVFDLFTSTEQQLHEALVRLSRGGKDTCYVKGDNAEHGGEGVWRVIADGNCDDMYSRFMTRFHERRHFYEEMNPMVRHALEAGFDAEPLSTKIVLQKGLPGRNKSVLLFIDPKQQGQIGVMAVTDQVVDSLGRNLGNVNYAVTSETIERLSPMIVGVVQGIWRHHPTAWGVLHIDYFETESGQIKVNDLGLRSSANTAAAMIRMEFEAQGNDGAKCPAVKGDFKIEMGSPITCKEIVERLGELVVPATVYGRKRGVFVSGWNHHLGDGRLVSVGRDEADRFDVEDEVLKLLGAKRPQRDIEAMQALRNELCAA